MALIIGQVTQEELAKLRSYGWKDEDPPSACVPEGDADQTRMFYVDNDVFKIMTGSDWDKTERAK